MADSHVRFETDPVSGNIRFSGVVTPADLARVPLSRLDLTMLSIHAAGGRASDALAQLQVVFEAAERGSDGA